MIMVGWIKGNYGCKWSLQASRALQVEISFSVTFMQKISDRRVYIFCICQMQFDESWSILSPQSRTKTLISPSLPCAAVLGVIMLPGSGLGFRFKSELRLPPGMLVFTPDNLQASTGPISLAGVEPIERVKEDWQSCCPVHTETCLL